jgi:hypothetical protein
MQSEDFDKKIVEAAENHHPVYNENAWAEMETLLNKHLPQEKKKRRRFLLWWILPLMLGGAALLIMQLRNGQKQTTLAANKEKGAAADEKNTTPHFTDTATKPADAGTVINPADAGTGTPTPENNLPVAANSKPGDQKNSVPALNSDNTLKDKASPGTISEKNSSMIEAGGGGRKKKQGGGQAGRNNQPSSDNQISNIKTDKPGTTADIDVTGALVKPAIIPADKPANQSEKITELSANNTEKESPKTDIAATEKNTSTKPEYKNQLPGEDSASGQLKKETATKKAGTKKKSSFFVSLSAGPDISFVSSQKAGVTKLVAGAGLGFIYKERFTLRTGFYSGRKVYSATADAYHAPPSFNQFYPYLEKVDANCKVYEIPVSVSYNFGKGAFKNWFVSTGLSSFLMHEETYNYFYKYTPTGNTYSKKWTLKNENYHYFSVATLSGGYQRKIGKNVTFIAEPYMKIPLGGVGYGKVKLNSGGVLFTIGVKPF